MTARVSNSIGVSSDGQSVDNAVVSECGMGKAAVQDDAIADVAGFAAGAAVDDGPGGSKHKQIKRENLQKNQNNCRIQRLSR